MGPFTLEVVSTQAEMKIVCIGIGGGGCDIVSHLLNKTIYDINFIKIDTNIESFIDKDFATEIQYEVMSVLKGAEIIFICSGLGGNTGTNISPIIAQFAQKIGALTISIVTLPFKSEGRQRNIFAKNAFKNIKRESDSVIILENDNVFQNHKFTKPTFKAINNAVKDTINGILGAIISSGENDFTIFFNDLKTVMRNDGIALVGIGEDTGVNSAKKAMKLSIENILLNNILIKNASGILINFIVHPNFPVVEMGEAMEIIHENADKNANIIFCSVTDKSLDENYVKVIMILTGFNKIANNFI